MSSVFMIYLQTPIPAGLMYNHYILGPGYLKAAGHVPSTRVTFNYPIVGHFEKYAYSFSCRELGVKTDTSPISIT